VTRELKYRMRKLDDALGGYECIVSIGDFHIGANSDTPEKTLYAASGLAAKYAEILDKHPELAAVIPPEATAALQAVQIAAYVARHGKLPPKVKTLSEGAVSTVKSILKGFL
jgi:hypothetical protein